MHNIAIQKNLQTNPEPARTSRGAWAWGIERANMHWREDEIEIDFYKSSGPGGQKKNTTESSVRVRHMPTGIVVIATESRSQHRNKEAALEELERRLALRNRRRTPRIPTKQSRASKARRVDDKKRVGEKKRLRQGRFDD